MEQPFLRLTAKDFLTGISPNAHTGTGGLFFKADGITPLFEAGSSQSPHNGMLMAGPVGTTIPGTLDNSPISSAQFTNGSGTTFYFGTAGSHIFSLALDTTFSTSLVDAHTASSLRQGMEIFNSASGSILFYFMDSEIGRFNLDSTWNDSWTSISSDDIHATHYTFDRLYFGNASYIGVIFDDGSGITTSSSSNTTKQAFQISRYGVCTDISDDGLNLVIATTKNVANDPNSLAGCNILFWDTFSTLPARVYSIPDPFIIALEKTSQGVFAIGTTGIWQVSYGAEPVKILSIPTGIFTNKVSGSLKYGRGASSYYAQALLWGGATASNTAVVKSFGKLESDAPNAYLHPFLAATGKNITLVDGQLQKGYVLVGDNTPQLVAYPFSSSATPGTGVSAQTVYIPLPEKTEVNRIDLVFGEPLASGDSISVGVLTDEATAVKTFGTASFASDGAIRRKVCSGTVKAIAEDQLSLKLTYTAGAPKVKAVEVYGKPMTP